MLTLKNKMKCGFEIEGQFAKTIKNKIKNGNFKFDGSVNDGSIKNQNDLDEGNLLNASEYASSVYTPQLAIKKLSLFKNGINYWCDASCGLHFHISLAGFPDRRIWHIINYAFIKSLQETSLAFCSCQNDRLLNHNNFCQTYKSKSSFLKSGIKWQNKYQFVRFHPDYNTLEFRFLSPCEHKTANVIKLLTALDTFLCENKKICSKSFDFKILAKPEKMKILHNLPHFERFNITSKINYSKKISLII